MLVRFDTPIAQDVLDLHLMLLSQMAGYQQEAMTLQGLVLRAEKRGTTPVGDFEHLSDALRERRSARHCLVARSSVFRVPPQLIAKVQVRDADLVQPQPQHLFSEVYPA